MVEPSIFQDVPKIITLADEMPLVPDGIVSRTLFKSPFARVVLFSFAEGEELSEHTSSLRVIVQILSGTCDFTVGSERRLLVAGDVVYMPPHLLHSVKATKAFSMLLTLITNPSEKEP